MYFLQVTHCVRKAQVCVGSNSARADVVNVSEKWILGMFHNIWLIFNALQNQFREGKIFRSCSCHFKPFHQLKAVLSLMYNSIAIVENILVKVSACPAL
jgi:hypothetical protein